LKTIASMRDAKPIQQSKITNQQRIKKSKIAQSQMRGQ